MHQFNIGGIIYGAPEFDGDGLSADRIFEATELRMVDFVFPYDSDEQTVTILYEYDFGDNWRHLLRLERLPREEGVTILAAWLVTPPEDVGGPHGYAEFLEAWHDPGHDGHKAMRRWVGRKISFRKL